MEALNVRNEPLLLSHLEDDEFRTVLRLCKVVHFSLVFPEDIDGLDSLIGQQQVDGNVGFFRECALEVHGCSAEPCSYTHDDEACHEAPANRVEEAPAGESMNFHHLKRKDERGKWKEGLIEKIGKSIFPLLASLCYSFYDEEQRELPFFS